MDLNRRAFLGTIACGTLGMAASGAKSAEVPETPQRTPVIDITDLYHPPQDPGDNVDLIAAYALPEIDLKAVILDVTERYRRPYVNPGDHGYDDPSGGRDPGYVPVIQLNSIFGREVPCAPGPYTPMRSPEDRMEDAPAFQQTGIELILRTLRESPVPVDIVSFGSARPLAVAFNRAPDLLREKMRRAYLCAGSASPGCLEWNVNLDVHAFVRVLRSGLPLAIYPCATEASATAMGPHNTYWSLPRFELIRAMTPALQRYLAFAFQRTVRMDFLAALEEEVPETALDTIAARAHNVWETDVWIHAANRRLVRRAGGEYRILPERAVAPDDTIVSSELMSCTVSVRGDGQFTFTPADADSPCRIFHRANPEEHQRALREALPELYASFLKTDNAQIHHCESHTASGGDST